MKYIAVLLVLGLFLAGCGNTTVTSETQPTALTPLELDTDALSTQAPGGPVLLPEFIGTNRSFGSDIEQSVLRHLGGLIEMETVASEGTIDPVLAEDSTWQIVEPLATSDATCFSLESQNRPGFFLRHTDARVRLDSLSESTNPDLLRADATWCSRASLDGRTDAGNLAVFSFESFNFPGYYMRRFDGEVWIAQSGGSLPSDAPDGFSEDASWALFEPLAGAAE